MKPSRLCLAALAACAAALVFTAVPTGKAHAFTFESAAPYNANGTANLADQDAQFGNTSSGNTIHGPGGVTMQFGGQNSQNSIMRDYNAAQEYLFNPVGHPEDPR